MDLKKDFQPRILYLDKLFFPNKEGLKTVSNKQNQKFLASMYALQKVFKLK